MEGAMSAPVGADVESVCGKCGDVWHVVVAKIGDQIVKVQCKQCGKQHRYGGRKATAAAGGATSTSGAPRRPRPTGPRPVVSGTPAVAADPDRPPRPYRPSESYTVADRILHPQFGTGVVESTAVPGRIEVFFDSGRKLLAHAKPTSTLERPAINIADIKDDDEDKDEVGKGTTRR
jgi:hypothetical protein